VRSRTSGQEIYERPAELLQQLIRFDTTNPPGNEAECVTFVQGLLAAAGLETTLLARAPERPNLIARLQGRGEAPPLLLYGHADVVTTAGQQWTYPPFEGQIADGYVWGRGALDMKGAVAMMVAAVLRARAKRLEPAGDVVLAVVCDEEADGDYGARYLVERHAEQFEGIRYALGEAGGFSIQVGRWRFYPIQVAEKQSCWLRATVRGPCGHGSLPMRGGAMSQLARFLRRLEERRLPVHVTPAVRQMIEAMGAGLPSPARAALRRALKPAMIGGAVRLWGKQGRLIEPLLRNTVNATIVHGGEKVNVIPGEITVDLDGRVLPGYGPDDLIAEVRQVAGPAVEIALVSYDPGPAEPDMGLFGLLAGVLRQVDPGGIPVPLLLSATTDARLFSRLGIQTYGFTPMQLPADFDFSQVLHAADERAPVEAVEFGARAIYQVLQQYGRP